jgi:hypothetical protein
MGPRLRAVPESWVCFFRGFEDVPWWSSHDQTGAAPLVECRRVDGPPAGVSGSSWLRAMRALAKAEFPF